MNKIMYALCASLILCVVSTVYAKSVENDFKENVVRLHIVANSNSEADQRIKLKVRDEILKHSDSKDVNEEKFIKIAENVLKENGFSYGARIEKGEFKFPRKTYKEFTFPKGEYTGMKVILGEGKGENWWCVMYPPLCFTEEMDGCMSEDGKKELELNLDAETYNIISNKPKLKFKIVELVNELIN